MRLPAMFLLLTLFVHGASAAESDLPITDGLARCAAIAETRGRLACFDRLAEPYGARPTEQTVRSAPATAPASAPATIAAPPMPVSPSAGSFGEEKLSSQVRPDLPEEERRLQARIRSLRSLPPDAFLVTLDNGQSWRHENIRQAEFLKVGDAITITRASLGTYRLTRDAGDAKNWIRVTRVR
jgi:hypothetical protein